MEIQETKFEIEVNEVTLLNLNKEYISSLTTQARNLLMDGVLDEMKLFVTAKKGLELFTQLEKIVRPFAEDKANLSKGEVYTLHGVELTETMNGVRYDFSNCNDSEWDDLNAQIKALDAQKKEREKFLKTLTKPMADPATGEVINPPIKYGKLGLNAKIK